MSVTLDKVSKSFEGRKVIEKFSLSLPDRGRFCFVGPSGCGKTTLLRLMTGLEKPDEGTISYPSTLRFACHFQENRLLPWYTAEENLSMIGRDSAQWLDKVGLSQDGGLYPHELSGGMKRRLSLARALMAPSDVLVLDEPLRELDPDNLFAMMRLIDQSVGDRLLLMVTHEITQAQALHCKIVEIR